jgi:hypothetical protein
VTSYKVLWPYVTIKVRGDAGLVLREFYAGAPVPENADPDDRARLLRKGAIVEEGTPEAELVAVPAGTPIPGEPPNEPVTEQPVVSGAVDERVARALAAADKVSTTDAGGRPKDYASKPEWVDWAVSQRPEDVSEEDARAQAEAKTKADLVAEYGG